MSDSSEYKQDPVCHMDVSDNDIHERYQGSHFYFCSEQCRERFVTNPHLYVGKAGIPSAKQQGMHVLKQRVIRLESPANEEIQRQLIEVLQAMMGVKEVDVEGDLVRIRYDLLEATAVQIEKSIDQSGAQLGKAWKDKLKSAFVHYLEETELDNLEHQHESHGCHHNDK